MSLPALTELFESHPGDLRVAELLSALRGCRAYFSCPSGNNGDEIIAMGCKLALEQYDISLVESPAEADVFVLRGGGALVDYYKSGLEVLQQACHECPDLPFVVLPHSVLYEQTDIRPYFAARQAPAVIFARERMSLENLHKLSLPGEVHVAVDDDMAFWLQGSEFVESWKRRATDDYVLIAERTDAERTGGVAPKPLPGGRLKRLLPAKLRGDLKRWLKRKSNWSNSADSPFAKQMLARCLADYPELSDAPIRGADVSDRGVVSFDGFCGSIAGASAVLTDRLHIGVFAALLGKPTYLKAGSYYKIPGIYEYSMHDWDHVRLVSDDVAE